MLQQLLSQFRFTNMVNEHTAWTCPRHREARQVINRDCSAIADCRKRRVRITPEAQAIFFRRRHQARTTPHAAIRPGSPAPTINASSGLVFRIVRAAQPVAHEKTPPTDATRGGVLGLQTLLSRGDQMLNTSSPIMPIPITSTASATGS